MVRIDNGQPHFYYTYNKHGILGRLLDEADIRYIDGRMESHFNNEVLSMAQNRADDKIYQNLGIIFKDGDDDDDDCI